MQLLTDTGAVASTPRTRAINQLGFVAKLTWSGMLKPLPWPEECLAGGMPKRAR